MPSYRWIAPIAIIWPLLAIGFTLVVFGAPPAGVYELIGGIIGFLLIGIFSGWGLIYSLREADNERSQLVVIIFYVLAIPLAYALGVGSPFVLEALYGISVPVALNYLVIYPVLVGLYGSLLLLGALALGRLAGLYIGRTTGGIA